MNISIFGLGYVGCVSLGCLAQNGHRVIGVDVQQHKVDLINKGKPTIIEKEIDAIIEKEYSTGRISATNDYTYAIEESDLSIICVGTPSTKEGHLDLSYVHNTAENIGEALKNTSDFHTVVIRSTVLPGTNKKVGEIIEKVSGKVRNVDFSVISNPEFLREGTAVKDYYNPSLTVIGGDSEKAIEIIASIYSKVDAPIEVVDIEVAEIIKYVNNSFHALKISFANEIGNISKALQIDSHKVMELFCKDTNLNISAAYFKPGFAYGGSCLPKDLKGLETLAHDHYLNSHVIASIDKANKQQKEMAISLIEETQSNRIGFMGLSFKEGTDDLRYSPSLDLVEYLIGRGYEISIYDRNVHISRLIGANKSYIEKHLPHIADVLTSDAAEVIDNTEVLVFYPPRY